MSVVGHSWILVTGDSYDRSASSLTDFERAWKERAADVEVLVEADFSESYEYDYLAVLRLDGQLALATTSGCSCPSPSETWDVKPCTLDEARAAIRAHDDSRSYGACVTEMNRALAALDAAVSS